jgi:RNA polymerase sigma-54 factor
MIQAIEQRRQTMLKVMNYIVERQRRLLREGRAVPQAAHAARGRGSHQHARIDGQSRDEREVRADAARCLPLKFFFSSGLSTPGEDVSRAASRQIRSVGEIRAPYDQRS